MIKIDALGVPFINHLVKDSSCDIGIVMPNWFYKEWQIMLSLQLVLMTLHKHITISIEQEK